jgi:alpha-tubulin suppressor-like RCC1 family protein
MGEFGDNVPVTKINDYLWNDVAAGYNHVLAIRADGTLWAWGSNGYGECGLGHKIIKILSPTQVGTATDWVSCGAGWYSSYAIKSSGAMYAWGRNQYYQLGLDGVGYTEDVVTPTLVNSTEFVYISGALLCAHAIDAYGNRWHCGSNVYGEAGQGNSEYNDGEGEGIEYNSRWKKIEDGILWVRVSGSKASTGGIGWSATGLGIDEDSNGYGWGWNGNGELGLDWNEVIFETPQLIMPGPVSDMAMGDGLSMLVKSDGTRWHAGWEGSNSSGYGDSADCEEHYEMDEWLNCSERAEDEQLWVSGKVAQTWSCALTRGGHVYVYGEVSYYGLTGDGTEYPYQGHEGFFCLPTLVEDIENVTKLAPTACSLIVLTSAKCLGNDMNPAHIIHDCLTNKQWGMGYNE